MLQIFNSLKHWSLNMEIAIIVVGALILIASLVSGFYIFFGESYEWKITLLIILVGLSIVLAVLAAMCFILRI